MNDILPVLAARKKKRRDATPRGGVIHMVLLGMQVGHAHTIQVYGGGGGGGGGCGGTGGGSMGTNQVSQRFRIAQEQALKDLIDWTPLMNKKKLNKKALLLT